MAAPDLINGLGGPAGFGSNILPVGDDNSSTAILLSSVFPNGGLNFFGTTYTSIYINNNGNLTFNGASPTFTPSQITANTSIPIIAPYFADVDTRGGSGVSTGGNVTGSDRVYWSLDTVNHVFTVTWDDVGYFNSHKDKLDAFQVQLIDESDTGAGNFDIEFRYEAVNWTTGDASGGSGGLGGTVARAGFSAGDGVNLFELPQSGNQSQMLGLPTTPAPPGTLGAQSQTGIYIFHVRNGVVQQTTLFDFVFTYNDGKDYYYGTVADNGSFGYHAGQLITTTSGEYNICQQGGATTQPSGTVAVTYYLHGGPGQASYTPVTTALGRRNERAGQRSRLDPRHRRAQPSVQRILGSRDLDQPPLRVRLHLFGRRRLLLGLCSRRRNLRLRGDGRFGFALFVSFRRKLLHLQRGLDRGSERDGDHQLLSQRQHCVYLPDRPPRQWSQRWQRGPRLGNGIFHERRNPFQVYQHRGGHRSAAARRGGCRLGDGWDRSRRRRHRR